MVSECSSLSPLTQTGHVLIRFTDDSGAFLETSLLPMLARMTRSKTQESSSGSSSRGGVATPGCKGLVPCSGAVPWQQGSAASSWSNLLLPQRRSIRTGTERIVQHFTSLMRAPETRLLGMILLRRPLHALPRIFPLPGCLEVYEAPPALLAEDFV
jgi:hypothetical protein